MNNTDIFMAFNAVDEGLIEQAVPREGKKVRARFLPAAAAACLLLGLGAAMAAAWLPKFDRQPTEQQAVTTPVPTPDISAMRIIEGTGTALQSGEEELPTPGRWKRLGTLWNTALNEKNADSLFAVSISFLLCAKEDLQAQADAYYIKPLRDAEHDPDYVELAERYEAFVNGAMLFYEETEGVDSPALKDEIEYYIKHEKARASLKVYYVNEEEKELHSKYPFQASLLIFLKNEYVERAPEINYEAFCNWKKAQNEEIEVSFSEEEKEKYENAIWNVISAIRENEERSKNPLRLVISDAIRAKCEKEADKLIQKGYYIDLESMHISRVGYAAVCCNAYLTKDQVLNFEPAPDEAYYIYFTSEEGVVDDYDE